MERLNTDRDKWLSSNWRMPNPGWGVLATVVLVVVGTGLRFGVPIYRQQQAIRKIETLGGNVGADYARPEWLGQWAGNKWNEMIGDADGVSLNNADVGDAELEHLKWLKNLEHLDIDSTKVTDVGLENLNGLTKLQFLSLDSTQVTDAGLEHLTGLTDLTELRLCGTQISDAGLAHLKRLTKLRTLSVSGTRVTEAGIANLKRALPRLYVFAFFNGQRN